MMNNPGQIQQVSRAAELAKVKDYLINAISREMESNPVTGADRRTVLNQSLLKAYQATRLQLPGTLRDQLFHEILDDMLGFGVLQPLIEDESITEIMVNGPKKIFIERNGKLVKTNVTFENDAGVLRIIEKIISPLGRRVDGDSPTVDARLPDGSRVNAVVAPCAIDGPTITIRKFKKRQADHQPVNCLQFDYQIHGRVCARLCNIAPEHRYFGRYRLGQDHPAERAFLLYPRG